MVRFITKLNIALLLGHPILVVQNCSCTGLGAYHCETEISYVCVNITMNDGVSNFTLNS